MSFKPDRETILVAGQFILPKIMEQRLFTIIKRQLFAFRLLHGDEEQYGLVIESKSEEDADSLIVNIQKIARNLFTLMPALCVVVGKFPFMAEEEKPFMRNCLRLAALTREFDISLYEYAVIHFVDGINAQKLCRPLVPVSYHNTETSAKHGLYVEKAQTPRTAKSVERRIREQLTFAHKIRECAARNAYTLDELGLTSLEQLNLLNELKHIFAIDIPLTATWEVNTIANLSVLIFTIIQEKNINLLGGSNSNYTYKENILKN